MVQLSQSPLRRPSPSCRSEEGEEKSMKPAKQQVTQGSPGDNPSPLSPLQATLHSATTTSQAYETYIENGLICLKHKIRNIEKKKLKLEDYKERLKKGESLNQDQLEAVEKYDEVIHNLEFAKELQKTFSGLSQDLLKTQRKAQRRENIMKLEAEKKKLRTVLQAQYVLQSLTQEHVQKDFRAGLNGAIYLPSKELDYLIKFAKLACPERSKTLSVEDQMEQSSLYFWDLLEGNEKIVVGTTYKHLKDLLSKLLDSGYFEDIPAPCSVPEKEELKEEMPRRPERTRQLSKPESVKEPEAQMVLEIQSQEFLNRRYMPEAECSSKKPEEPKSWGMEHSKKKDLPRSWETLVDMEEQEQKKQNQESLKPLESLRQQVKRHELPTPWEVKEDDHQRELPKPWVAARVRDQQASPKHWMNKAKEDPEQKQELTKTWDGKTDGVSGQGIDAVRKKESLQSVGESCKLPRSLPSIMQVPKPMHPPATEFCSTSSLPKDPVLRREKLQDLMTQIQGTYNFMQESLLDFDKPSQSAVCSSQAPPVESSGSPSACKDPKLTSQNDFPEQSVQAAASPVTLHDSNSSLASDQTTSGSGPETELELGTPETPQASLPLSQESEDFSSPQSLYQASQRIPEPLMPKKIETAPAPVPLSSEPQIPSTPSTAPLSPVPQAKANFPSPPASSSSVTVKAAPFQAMQTVFKVNAPLPPRREQDIKENSPHPAGYNQNFSTASTQTPLQCKLQSAQNAEQTAFSQESLSNAANYHAEGTVPVSNGSLTFYAAQTTPFPRPPQPFVTNRGSVRGPLRGTRSVTNNYRTSGGYKAGFEAYRGSPSMSNGGYSQLQIPVRDYSSVQYPQRDVNYPPNYKRGGGINSGRANSRAGWSDSSQVSSPERDNETFNSGDSGQGDSRSITPVDMPVTSQAATILPVHVYPLPQQMRVAFSAARTSNLAPGTLDQPIAFDLLLNNLGETFDIQLGRFNCPVNGTYVFIFHMLKLAVNVPLYVNLMKNEEVLVSAYANDGAPDHETASNHAVLQLFQGDQIWLRLHRGAIYGSSWKYSTFSGYLLYQD
ncbi:caprin-2 isoform X8 [Paroedura picta]|uniref:caprin-2 isoform X8 n=1 Tax=Paroedura picta TaxID=143630 RepID=UPI004056C476